jgi:hypothetical protein
LNRSAIVGGGYLSKDSSKEKNMHRISASRSTIRKRNGILNDDPTKSVLDSIDQTNPEQNGKRRSIRFGDEPPPPPKKPEIKSKIIKYIYGHTGVSQIVRV